ncbi:DUF397 domain-containing protein [Streptomyces sp. UNOC14_S4]|uniref:DUF397 domain-containing protein n=1 Tax=Streptomyces sp. UNOC14_S4 TaxID=2872340 RepID=UPI001E383A5F|nr:DUF397 domain-containing protein [Streptomyces sp. UNOC14_S4]MCC3767850.1 DUF397 domain-containing protein [Streptomyces sp. UNOC14_S4]
MKDPWFKSSYSGGEGNDMCVEIISHPHTHRIRDSKLPHSPHLAVTARAWTALLAYTTTEQPRH